MIDLVTVDFDLISAWLKENHISRRKLCLDTGIPEGTISAAFMRKSKMQVAYVWRIADYMGVKPITLLSKDKDGNVDPEDWDRISFGRTDYEIEIENQKIKDILGLLKGFNAQGLDEIGKIIGLLWEVPRLRKNENEYFDGTDDYWKKHPRRKISSYDEATDHSHEEEE